MKRVPITDSLTNGSPIARAPSAQSCAIRADVPVPHGERSSQPGWIEVALTASAPSRPGAWKTTWRQPEMCGSAGCTGGAAASMAAMISAPRAIRLSASLGSTFTPASAAGTSA